MNLIKGWLEALRGLWDDIGASIKEHRFFKDRLSLAILIAGLALNATTIIVLVLRLHPTDFPVPIQYSSLEGFNSLGHWYQLYQVGVFGLLVTTVNAYLAYLSFTRSRITSFFLLVGAFVVSLFSLIISLAFSAVV